VLAKVKYYPNLQLPVIVNARGRQGASAALSGLLDRGTNRRGGGGMGYCNVLIISEWSSESSRLAIGDGCRLTGLTVQDVQGWLGASN